ncbi:MAG: aminomethyltransferase family protein [Planctomycetota bacterium]
MPEQTPFHARTAALCTSYRWKSWAGFHAVCSYDVHHEPEYFALRHSAGLLDVCPLFKYRVRGPQAGKFLAWVMARDIGRLSTGRVTYTCLCDEAGKVVDDGTVARLGPELYRVTTAGPSLAWLLDHARGFRVEIADESTAVAALALQGPTARDLLASVATEIDLHGLRFFGIAPARIGDHPVEISRTGYTGDLGYELWLAPEHALAVWDELVRAGRDFALLPVGLDALDMTRVEAGFVLQDVDYHSALRTCVESRKSSPFELGLGWTVNLDRAPFVGQAALRREQKSGATWGFVGLELDWDEIQALYAEAGLPPQLPTRAWRTAVPVFGGGAQVGQATSGTWSPLLKKNLALASVKRPYDRLGTRLAIEFTVEYERHTVTAEVVRTPFFDPDRKKA